MEGTCVPGLNAKWPEDPRLMVENVSYPLLHANSPEPLLKVPQLTPRSRDKKSLTNIP
jgi:hypothetical protein